MVFNSKKKINSLSKILITWRWPLLAETCSLFFLLLNTIINPYYHSCVFMTDIYLTISQFWCSRPPDRSECCIYILGTTLRICESAKYEPNPPPHPKARDDDAHLSIRLSLIAVEKSVLCTCWYKANHDTHTTRPVINYLSLGFVETQRKIYQIKCDDNEDSHYI